MYQRCDKYAKIEPQFKEENAKWFVIIGEEGEDLNVFSKAKVQ